MSLFSKILTIIISVGIISGCASTPSTVTPDATASYKRIGIISITAQTFVRQYVGFTVFGNESEKVDSSSWEIDSKYEQQIYNELKSLGGFEVFLGPYPRAEFLHVNDLNGPWDAPAFRGPNWPAIESPIKNYCSKNQVNAILTVFAVDGPDFIGGTNQYIHGAGLYVRGMGDSTRYSYLHLISGVALVDCQTNKPVAARGLATLQKGWPGEILRASPLKTIPPEISRLPLNQLTESQLAEIKGSLVELPKEAWGPTIHAIFGR